MFEGLKDMGKLVKQAKDMKSKMMQTCFGRTRETYIQSVNLKPTIFHTFVLHNLTSGN